jgi:hypothetical protein
MIYFDLDGVLRDLCSQVFPEKVVTDWEFKDELGRNIYQIVCDKPDHCKLAGPTQYLKTINDNFEEIHILSNQPKRWQPFTDEWLEEYLEIPYYVCYTKGPEQKLDILEEEDILVEDYPFFSRYNQIILIDQPYNQMANSRIRVTNPEGLLWILKEFE